MLCINMCIHMLYTHQACVAVKAHKGCMAALVVALG